MLLAGRLHMVAFWVAVCISSLVTVFLGFLPFFVLGKEWSAAQDKARERRMAEHRMDARLLRLNL